MKAFSSLNEEIPPLLDLLEDEFGGYLVKLRLTLRPTGPG
jgi:hypothetical protein